MRFQKSGIRGRNILVAHGHIPHLTPHIPHLTSHISHPSFHIHHLTPNTPHSTFHIQHFTSNISHPTFHIPHSTLNILNIPLACEISVPILRTGGAICVVDKHPAWFLCRSVASAGEIFLCRMAHSPFRRSPCEGHIPHSQHSSPKSTRFFPSRPAPRPNTPFSAHHCNRLTFSHLSSEDPTPPSKHSIPHHETPSFDPRSLPFRGSIPYLSPLDP